MATILWPACERYNLSRSGYIKACGIEIFASPSVQEIYLEPLSSKGTTRPARIVVPRTHLKALRDALDTILASQEQDAKPANCRAPNCSLIDQSEGRCCGYMEAQST